MERHRFASYPKNVVEWTILKFNVINMIDFCIIDFIWYCHRLENILDWFKLYSLTISINVATDPPRIVPIPTSQSAMKNATRITAPDIGLFTKQVYERKIIVVKWCFRGMREHACYLVSGLSFVIFVQNDSPMTWHCLQHWKQICVTF